MTAFQIYAAFGAPFVLFVLCALVVLVTRPRNARPFWSSSANLTKPPVETEIAEMKARITRMEAQVDRLRDTVGDNGSDVVLRPAAQ